MAKKSLDNLIGKLEKELDLPTIKEPTVFPHTVAIGDSINRTIKANVPSPDPFNMKSKVNQARKARQAEILRRHNLAKATNPIAFDSSNADEDEDQDEDLKENLDFVDENKDKTMEWTEPDGSKTTLKFDQDGTLIGKETTKSSRPDKFSKDLKKAVDRNAVALKDYEESLMTDPVQ